MKVVVIVAVKKGQSTTSNLETDKDEDFLNEVNCAIIANY